jgi:hypothetical protein
LQIDEPARANAPGDAAIVKHDAVRFGRQFAQRFRREARDRHGETDMAHRLPGGTSGFGGGALS